MNCELMTVCLSRQEGHSSNQRLPNGAGKQYVLCIWFSVEYLQSIGLLRLEQEQGVLDPNDLAAFAARLVFTKPSNFAILSLLLSDGGNTLKMLSQRGRPNREVRVVSILCHLFCRSLILESFASWAQSHKSETGPSIVVLPRLYTFGHH